MTAYKKDYSYEASLQNIVNFSNNISNKITNSKSLFENIINGNLSSDYAKNNNISPSIEKERYSKLSLDKLSRPFSLYFSDRSSTSKCTSQSGFLSGEDDDYGFYDENEQQGMNLSIFDDSESGILSPCNSPLSKNQNHLSPIKDTNTTIKIEDSNQKLNTKNNIICILENSKSSMACRSFKVGGKVHMTSISMRGCRIAQTELGITAQYKFILSFESNEYIVWKQFSDFRLLANSIIEYHQIKKSKGPSYNRTINAWNEVVRSRPWFYQDLTIRYLSMESSLLDTFMTNLFYEVENVNVFLEFVV